jgi:hypothetical protein
LLPRSLGLALVVGVVASGCGTAQSALPFVPPDAPLRYSTYFSPQGHMRDEGWALALMGHPAHREQVFLQAQQSLYPAVEAWLYLEAVSHGAGALLAQDHARPGCAVLPSEFNCEFNWNPVRSLIPGEGPGRDRLLEVYKQGYDARWEQLQRKHHAQVEIARAGMLMAGTMLGRTPAAAEGQAAAAEERAAKAEGTALGAEARAVTAEARAASADAARLVSAETLGLSRALGAEEASALEARLLELEAESLGKREAFSMAELRSGRLSPKVPPSELPAEYSALWNEFEAYRQRRFQEVLAEWRSGKSTFTVKPPLRWNDYQKFREHFQSCQEFETRVGGVLLRELEQPAGSRQVLRDSQQPLLARHLGTRKEGQAGVRYPDYLAVDEASLKKGSVPRVESVSVKKRDFSSKSRREVERQVEADAKEALSKYGGELEVRRPGHPLYGRTVQVSKVHLVYAQEGIGDWKGIIERVGKAAGVEVHFE